MFNNTPDTSARRVILVVLDGLRPDAIGRFDLRTLDHLVRNGAATVRAQTVSPSVTACAMASLLTGATPQRHGFQSDRFGLPHPSGSIHPLPRVLRDHGFPTSAHLARVPILVKPMANRIAAVAGVQKAHFSGRDCESILATADGALASQKRGLILLHWPDADRAGHANGWMSPTYATAARKMDAALGSIAARIDADDTNTLLVVVADHGGGGTHANNHETEHPLNSTIPVVFAGGAVAQGDLGDAVSILDVPATILWYLGISCPESYAGTPLTQAFKRGVGQPHRTYSSVVLPFDRKTKVGA